jgi:glutamine amidotransferase
VHNGQIRGFSRIKRELALAVSPELYGEIIGTTDSEIMFYLALTFGMADDIAGGLSRMVGFVEEVGKKNGIDHPMQMTLGISDGQSLYACRYSTERQTRTLYHSASVDAIRDVVPGAERFSSDMRAIVSEPLSDLAEVWVPVPESSFVKVMAGDVTVTEFAPAQ